jgi:plasmid stabilization system protein ParE
VIIVSRRASEDLDEWITRIERDNPIAAREFLLRIRRSVQMIEEHPESGHRHPRRNVRYIVESPLKIYYLTQGDSVRILRFWHSSRNPKSIRYE